MNACESLVSDFCKHQFIFQFWNNLHKERNECSSSQYWMPYSQWQTAHCIFYFVAIKSIISLLNQSDIRVKSFLIKDPYEITLVSLCEGSACPLWIIWCLAYIRATQTKWVHIWNNSISPTGPCVGACSCARVHAFVSASYVEIIM